jgi:hypothetical protein
MKDFFITVLFNHILYGPSSAKLQNSLSKKDNLPVLPVRCLFRVFYFSAKVAQAVSLQLSAPQPLMST